MNNALDLIARYAESMRGLALKSEDGRYVDDASRELVRTAVDQFRSAGDGSDAIESTRALRARLVMRMESSLDTQIRFRVALEHAVAWLDQA